MQATCLPNPCPAGGEITVVVVGGTPPFYYALEESPPNPPGLELILAGGVAKVRVPEGVPSGTVITVLVKDSGDPQQGAAGRSRVA